MTILVMSNHNSFRVLFDKIASISFTSKKYNTAMEMVHLDPLGEQ